SRLRIWRTTEEAAAKSGTRARGISCLLSSEAMEPLNAIGLKRDAEMTKALFAMRLPGAAVAALVIITRPSDARIDVQAYRYCSLDHNGGTGCYFDDRVACAKAGSGRCIENPYYSSAYAATQQPRASARRHHPGHQSKGF